MCSTAIPSTFFTTELHQALLEQKFGLNTFHLTTSTTSLRAAASVTLLEGNTITISLTSCGYTVRFTVNCPARFTLIIVFLDWNIQKPPRENIRKSRATPSIHQPSVWKEETRAFSSWTGKDILGIPLFLASRMEFQFTWVRGSSAILVYNELTRISFQWIPFRHILLTMPTVPYTTVQSNFRCALTSSPDTDNIPWLLFPKYYRCALYHEKLHIYSKYRITSDICIQGSMSSLRLPVFARLSNASLYISLVNT